MEEKWREGLLNSTSTLAPPPQEVATTCLSSGSPYWTTEEVFYYFKLNKKSRARFYRWRKYLHFPKPFRPGGGKCLYRILEVLAWEQKQNGPDPYKMPSKEEREKATRESDHMPRRVQKPIELGPNAFRF